MKPIVRHALALLAEDEPLLRMDTADMLADAGFTVIEAADAEAALRSLEKMSTIELLVTDIDMPGSIDGIDLAKLVAERWPGISIVVCSGRIKPDEGALPANARFISKPFSPDIVIGAVQEAMN